MGSIYKWSWWAWWMFRFLCANFFCYFTVKVVKCWCRQLASPKVEGGGFRQLKIKSPNWSVRMNGRDNIVTGSLIVVSSSGLSSFAQTVKHPRFGNSFFGANNPKHCVGMQWQDAKKYSWTREWAQVKVNMTPLRGRRGEESVNYCLQIVLDVVGWVRLTLLLRREWSIQVQCD